MINLFNKIFRSKKSNKDTSPDNSTATTTTNITGSKDPNDYTLNDLSTAWISEDHYCVKCKKSTGHNEYMSDICNSCGSWNTQKRYGRVYRQILINGVWKFQIKYKEGHEEIRDDWF